MSGCARDWLLVVVLLVSAGWAVAQPEEPEPEGTLIIAQARWPGQDLTRANFYVFADATMKDLVDIYPSGGPGGAAFIGLKPGQYYIMVVVDVNGSGTTDEGDAFGWYGVEDLAPSSRPQPLVVGEAPAGSISIPILLTRAADGSLVPLPGAPRGRGTITGRLTGIGEAQACLVLRGEAEARSFPAALAAPDGSFSITAQGGSYALLAHAAWIDEAGAAGAPSWRLLTAPDAPVRITPDQTTDLGEVAAPEAGAAPESPPALMVGSVTGPPVPEGSEIHVQVCADETMRSQVTAVQAAPSGPFALAIEPATYYLRAIVGDDTVPGPGDLLGFYGVADLAGEDRPQPVALGEGEVRDDLTIPIVARIAEDGTITTVTAADTTAGNETGE